MSNNLKIGYSGIMGGFTKYLQKAYALIEKQNEEFSIEVDTMKGQGDTYKARENAKITISFPDKTNWTGTIKELQGVMKK